MSTFDDKKRIQELENKLLEAVAVLRSLPPNPAVLQFAKETEAFALRQAPEEVRDERIRYSGFKEFLSGTMLLWVEVENYTPGQRSDSFVATLWASEVGKVPAHMKHQHMQQLYKKLGQTGGMRVRLEHKAPREYKIEKAFRGQVLTQFVDHRLEHGKHDDDELPETF